MSRAGTYRSATDTAKRILSLFDQDRVRIQNLKSKVGSLLRVHEAMQSAPLLRVPLAVQRTGLSEPTVRSCFNILIEQGIARETSGKKRDRLYVYDPYLRILEEGTEPL
jgi:Fic family protein